MKNLKTLLSVSLIFCAAFAFGAKYPFGTKTYNGGRVEPVSLQMLASTNEHMNFCFAHQFSDKSMYMYHSEGVHTVTETSKYIYSMDNGKTWKPMPRGFNMLNVYENKAGQKCSVSCWNAATVDEHTFVTSIMGEDFNHTSRSVKVKLPFKASVHLHRDALRLQDGTLLINGYGRREGQTKHLCYVFASKDDGMTWEFRSILLEDTQNKYVEGANEAVMIQLANGDVLGYARTGSSGLMQMRSKDNGQTWGAPVKISPIGVSPDAVILTDGTIVVTSGRPKLEMLVDFTGTGENYETFMVWNSSGSSYATLIETAPNQVTLFYDESDFGSWRQPSNFSRIMAAKYNIVKDESLKFDTSAHPKAKEYKYFYTPASKQYPGSQGYIPYCILPKDARTVKNGTYWELREIPERPHPILHIAHQGVDAPHKFSHFNAEIEKNIEYSAIETAWELRIADMSSKDGQFRVILRTAKGNYMAYVDCGKDHLKFFDNGKIVRVPFKMDDGKFYAFRFNLKGDGTYEFFKGNDTKPMYTGKAIPSGTGNVIQLGDGSSGIFGAIDLSYFGYNLKR